MVKKYLVKLEITNNVWVEADSPDEAENKVYENCFTHYSYMEIRSKLFYEKSYSDPEILEALRNPTPLMPIFSILDGAKYKANVDIFSEKEIV